MPARSRVTHTASLVALCCVCQPSFGSYAIYVGKNHGELAQELRHRVERGDWILFKGSRGMRMERVLDALKSGKA